MNWLQKIFKSVTVRFDTHEEAMQAMMAKDTLCSLHDIKEKIMRPCVRGKNEADPSDVLDQALKEIDDLPIWYHFN